MEVPVEGATAGLCVLWPRPPMPLALAVGCPIACNGDCNRVAGPARPGALWLFIGMPLGLPLSGKGCLAWRVLADKAWQGCRCSRAGCVWGKLRLEPACGKQGHRTWAMGTTGQSLWCVTPPQPARRQARHKLLCCSHAVCCWPARRCLQSPDGLGPVKDVREVLGDRAVPLKVGHHGWGVCGVWRAL